MRRFITANYQVQLTTIFIAATFLASCVGAEQMFPTETPTPNLTIAPTATVTPTNSPTPTATPSLTPTPEPIVQDGPIATAVLPLRLGREEKIFQGGFSFRPPIGYDIIYQPNQATMTSADLDTVFSLLGGKVEREKELEAEFQEFIELIALQLVEFSAEDSFQFLVDGIPGLAARVNGMYGETQVTGRILIVAPEEDQLFYALAISPDTTSGEGWEPEGRQAFEAIMDSVSFFEPQVPEE